ncbi:MULTISPECIES: EboA domain-containing protein [unclassified Amycolatopsis]|uniref:EboA domain-containing protein n=1 Tax=unclassified Amycolatopsis TaxID=2618356 RepID=UPI0028750005|nr:MULTISPECIES: EboA domain-containing protein [unclassified Amycolatopsis]MDS0136300.1 EboA domain-containing protein [Amycolatopsis sp. 505]MDS0145815.1 EboA domain-containing protein [Amycolatopsis sp. CM201R]
MNAWLEKALSDVAADAKALRTVFPAVGRRVGRTAADTARVELLAAAPGAAAEMPELYRYGDAAEKRAILYGLSVVDIGDAGIELVADALRTNDTRLVAAAMGEYAATHLDPPAYRHGVLKCVFMGIPLAAVAGLDRRTDDELLRMLRDFAAERTAAGREVPADLRTLLNEQDG